MILSVELSIDLPDDLAEHPPEVVAKVMLEGADPRAFTREAAIQRALAATTEIAAEDLIQHATWAP